jgi:hypothetical protein
MCVGILYPGKVSAAQIADMLQPQAVWRRDGKPRIRATNICNNHRHNA